MKYFIAIDNKDNSVLAIDALINTIDRMPNFAMEILGKTKHYGHIKKGFKEY